MSPGFHPVHLPAPEGVTWCRSTCCYCGCAGASPRAVAGERMEKGGGQAAGIGPQPPPYRAQGPHLGGAGQELLLLPGRCHRGDEAQRGQVLPFLLEKKRKVINSTTRGHSLPNLKAFKNCLLPLGKKSRLLSSPHKTLQDTNSDLVSTTLPCLLDFSPTCSFAHPACAHQALCSCHCRQQPALGCMAGPFMPFRSQLKQCP